MAWRYREAIRNGRLLYRTEYPIGIQLTTAAPRVLLQCIFFTLAGRALFGRTGGEYTFVGIAAFAACTKTVVLTSDIPWTDTMSDTYYRLQAGSLRPWAIYLCRIFPYIASGFLSTLLVLAVGGPILGLTSQSISLLPLTPLYLLTAATSAAFGLTLAGLSVGQNSNILLGNLGSYLILATAGIVVPYTHATRWLSYVGSVLPIQHGLAAIRAQLAGRPWGGQAALEALTGVCWIVLAVLVLWIRDRRQRGVTLIELLRGVYPAA
jgi:hypothetical protein